MGKSRARRAHREAGDIQAQAATQASTANAGAITQVSEMQRNMYNMAAEETLRIAEMYAGGHSGAGAINQAANLTWDAAQGAIARIEPYADFGEQFISMVEEASTLEGLENRLGQIADSESFQALRDERMEAADARLAAAGHNNSGRAGREAADISMSTALGIEGMLFGRQQQAMNTGYDFARDVGNAEISAANTRGNFIARAGSASASAANSRTSAMRGAHNQALGYRMQGIMAEGQGILGSTNQTSQGLLQSANARAGALIGGENAAQQQLGNILGVVGSVGAAYAGNPAAFSDERLKTNMEPVGRIKDLMLYEWDWKEEVKGLFGTEMSLGFKAQEVQEKYPDCVQEIEGVLAVLYDKLTPKLNERVAA
jgi:hypothetical protein